ncbi:MAG: hypothetical protein ACYS8X_05290 [Planctomycetota bacterium]|jgi:hypothetical protein
MSDLTTYFRQHRWQRRAVVASVGFVIAMALTVALYPLASDRLLIRRLGDESDFVRERAIRRATVNAGKSPTTLRRLEGALDTANDRRFYGIASALGRIGKFRTPQRAGRHFDRMAAIQFEATDAPASRWLILHAQCIADRDNEHLRRLLVAASADEKPEIRETAAVLAAKLGDDAILERLLADDAPVVRASAALDACLAGRELPVDQFTKLLDDDDDTVVASAAFALARQAPQVYAETVAPMLLATGPAGPSRRLLWSLSALDSGEMAADLLTTLISRPAGPDGPAATTILLAGSMLNADLAGDQVRSILASAAKPDKGVRRGQLQAALAAAGWLDMPVRKEVYDIVYALWDPALEPSMAQAARLLGQQTNRPQEGRRSPTSAECVKALQQGTMWRHLVDDPKDNKSPQYLHTPLASAAAAVALWELQTPLANKSVRSAARSDYTLPGDLIAWQLATSSSPDDAYVLGELMLPAPGAADHLRVFNDNERAAGAMLLALSARTDSHRSAAVERISQRLYGTGAGGEDNPYVQLSYRCALLILGEEDHRSDLHDLLSVLEFPQRRVLTALLAAGDRRAMDWLLWNPQISPESLEELLVGRGIGEPLSSAHKQLAMAAVIPAAPYEIRVWQAKMLSDLYAIHHAEITPRRLW